VSDDERTEPATAKRRGEALEKGQIPRSADLTAVVLLGCGMFALMWSGPMLARGLGEVMRTCFGALSRGSDLAGISVEPGLLVNREILLALLTLGAVIVVFVAASQILQTGWNVVTSKFFEDPFSRFNPINGIKQFFNLRKLVTTLMNTAKMALIIVCAYMGVKSLADADVFTRPTPPAELAAFLITAAWTLGWRILMAMSVIAIIDFFYQKWQHEKDLKMTKQEVKDEFKSLEGNQEIKGRIRGKRLELYKRSFKSVRRMIEDVQDASIVITNPTHYAVAVRYVRGETPVPIVVAKGQRRIAQRIKDKAIEVHVPIRRNVEVARGLFKHCEVGDPIPELFYQGVATLLAQLLHTGLLNTRQPDSESLPSGENEGTGPPTGENFSGDAGHDSGVAR
jgi:flagellar biosynthetic protein FlhB